MEHQQLPEKIRAVAQEFDDAVEQKDMDTILSCFVEDCEVEVFGLTLRGKSALQRSIEWMYQDLGDIGFEPRIILVHDNVYFEEFIMRITLPHGEVVRIKSAEVLVYENYKVKTLRLYIDRFEIIKALPKGFIGKNIVKYIDKYSMKELYNIFEENTV